MPVQTTQVELVRTFYTQDAYIPDPPNSLYYTLGISEPVTSPGYEDLYTTGALVESSFEQLYIIPASGRSAVTSDIIDYSVVEDITTLSPAEYTGGSAQITVQSRRFPDGEEFFTSSMTLKDSLNGEVLGTVRGLSIDDSTTAITADSLVALLNVPATLPTQRTNLRTAVANYLNTIGLTIPTTFEDGLGNLSVRLPSWDGNAWDAFKQMASAYGFEITFVGNNLVFRRPRKTTIDLDRATRFSQEINAQGAAKKVRVHYYQNEYATRREVYPVPEQPATIKAQGSDYVPSEPTIYTVDAAEILTFTIDLQASLTSINTPDYIPFVADEDYSGTNGVFSAVGNDDLPVTPKRWAATGGSISVRLLDNQRQVEVTIIGPNDTELSPYRIAMSSGSGNYYNSLHLTGTGLIITDDFVDLTTGATVQTTAQEIGTEVTNPYIDSLSRAYTAGQYAAAEKALTYEIAPDGYVFIPEATTFGNVAGARVEAKNSKFRVNTATSGPALTSFRASHDVTIGDVNEVYAGMTMGEVSQIWSGRTMLDFSIAPLKNG